MPCGSNLNSDKITSLLIVFFPNLSSSVDDILAAVLLQNGSLDYALFNGNRNLFHLRLEEEHLIQYLFQANGL